jgi:flagellin
MATGDLSRVRTNIQALNALNALKGINAKLNIHNLRLATGKRINTAGDDPAGLTLATRLDARARGLAQALNNIGDAENVLATAEGGFNNMNELLVQMKELVTKAANDTLGASERTAVYNQLGQLGEEIDDLVRETTFNNQQLMTNVTFTFQTGSEGTDITRFNVTGTFTSLALSVNALTVATQLLASASLGSVNAALNSVGAALQNVGAKMGRLTVKQNNVTVGVTNVRAAASRIMDADMALEQLEASKLLILQQTATAMLAQANSAPTSILSLFQ